MKRTIFILIISILSTYTGQVFAVLYLAEHTEYWIAFLFPTILSQLVSLLIFRYFADILRRHKGANNVF